MPVGHPPPETDPAGTDVEPITPEDIFDDLGESYEQSHR